MTRFSKPTNHLFIYRPDPNYPNMNWWVWRPKWIAIVTAVCVLAGGIGITGLVFGVNQIGRQVSVESCRNWGIKNDRETKWASFNLFSYECLTKSYDGKWVSTDYPQQFIPLNVNAKTVK